ncbi:CBS domain-containing protein [Allosaccharopolyspora coralli]|uniref:CBS domain-containing protein n=1 Tax=Allosaccharopolyspora coralli TaxID=2665642 RepID=A0A5Q3QG94_9PSEU|nr:CBS domain-containing protein [Allosaccharopolyspora coralli]QGK70555.1 CBS domain-containing protein [Allosaccharopolyspora coralli]
MRITDVLTNKGTTVTTVRPEETVEGLLRLLDERNIGAVVVAGEGTDLAGIVSERDVVRRLAEHGAAVLGMPVGEIMTTDVVTCTPEDEVEDLTVLMTERRVRHVPVVADGELLGIVSIGDVVKSRISTLEHHREQMEHYITQG